MKRKFKAFLSLCLVPFLACCGDVTPENQDDGPKEFYEKDVPYFGIPRHVPKYTVTDTIKSNKTDYIKYHGRNTYISSVDATFFSYSAAGFEITFTGTTLEGYFLTTNANSAGSRPFLAVSIDNDYDPDKATPIQLCNYGDFDNSSLESAGYAHHQKIVLAHSLENTKHTVRIFKRSEAVCSRVGLRSLSCDGSFLPVEAKQLDYKIEVFGDSVSCGYAVESDDYYEKFSTRTENATKTFVNYAANELNADISIIAAGGYPLLKSTYAENNYPNNIVDMFSMQEVEHHTSTMIAWDNLKYVPDVVVIALGANDQTYVDKYKDNPIEQQKFLTDFKQQYQNFINKIIDTYGEKMIVISDEIIWMKPEIISVFDQIVSENKDKHNVVRAKYTAFDDAVNRTTPGEGHPNQEMQQIAGKQLAKIIKDNS